MIAFGPGKALNFLLERGAMLVNDGKMRIPSKGNGRGVRGPTMDEGVLRQGPPCLAQKLPFTGSEPCKDWRAFIDLRSANKPANCPAIRLVP
jgi:hypothetical protein